MPATPTETVTLFDVPVANLTLDETVARIVELIRAGPTHQHAVVNVDKLVKFQRDPELRAALLDCDLITADGQAVVWASRLVGKPLKQRVTGIDLFGRLIERCAIEGLRPYLLGARQEVVERVVEILRSRHPTLRVAGSRNGYWTPAEEPAVVAGIRSAKPDVLFVAMGSPQKELFIRRWKQELQVPFVMGVGGTFDVVAGRVRRAPAWMQRAGLEWFYRFCQEPRRLWRRYFVEDLAFLPLLWREFRRSRSRRSR